MRRGRSQTFDEHSTGFGCARCYGDDALATWTYCAEHLVIERFLVDDFHFIVQLRRCPACSQQFVSVFTEFIDWAGGDDGQYRDVVPVTTAEGQTLAGRGEDIDVAFVESLGRDRRYLQVDWPTGQREARIRWSKGNLLVRPGH